MADGPPRARIIIIEVRETETNIADVIRELGIYNNSQIIYQGEHVGDTYFTNQAGAVGPHSKIENSTFVQSAGRLSQEFDLVLLASQLDQLRSAMRKESSDGATLEQEVAIGKVAEAQVAAQAGDQNKTLSCLKQAGSWALEVAKKVGAEIAALALAHSLAG
jgi:hypothetical protein